MFSKFERFIRPQLVEKPAESEVTRQAIHEKSMKGERLYSQGVHAVNEVLMKKGVPLPSQGFGQAVINNIEGVEHGTKEESGAFLTEAAYLARDATGYLVKGMFKGVEAKSAYNTGKAFSKSIDTGAEDTTLGALCLTGALATTAASFIAGSRRKAEYNTGKAFKEKLSGLKEAKEMPEEPSSSFKL